MKITVSVQRAVTGSGNVEVFLRVSKCFGKKFDTHLEMYFMKFGFIFCRLKIVGCI